MFHASQVGSLLKVDMTCFRAIATGFENLSSTSLSTSVFMSVPIFNDPNWYPCKQNNRGECS